jgi:hypothetical protein
MKRSLFKPLLWVVFFSSLNFSLHYYVLIFLIGENTVANFYYSLFQIYILFTVCSLFIIAGLILVRKRNLDNVGYFYLLLTMIKMGIAYFFLHEINQNSTTFLIYEKKSFFASFIIFLAMETLITARLLNKNQ